MSRGSRVLVVSPVLASATLMILAVAAMRLLPHPANFTPVLAMALFGGARLGNRSAAFAIPLGAMFLSDVAIEITRGSGLHPWLPVVYVCVALAVGLGLGLRTRRGAAWTAGGAIASAVVFYLVTNFVVWVGTGMYPATLAGLGECYLAAVPFFRSTLASTLVYSAALFAGHELVRRRWARAARDA